MRAWLQLPGVKVSTVYCGANKENHFTTDLYPCDLLNIPTPTVRRVQFHHLHLPKYYETCFWLLLRSQQCQTILKLDQNIWVRDVKSRTKGIVFLPLANQATAYLSKCPISSRSDFAGKQRMRSAQVTGFWVSPPISIQPPPAPFGESGIRYNLRVSENFCEPQYQGQEIKWNYVTLPPYAGPTTKTAKSQLPSFFHFLPSEVLPFGIFF